MLAKYGLDFSSIVTIGRTEEIGFTEELILSVANNLAEMEIREVRDGDKMEQLLLLIRTQISKVCQCSLFVCGPSHYEVIRAARTY